MIHSVGVFSCTTRRHWTLPEGCTVVLEDSLFWWWALLRPTPPTKKKRSRLAGRTQCIFSFGARLALIRFEVHMQPPPEASHHGAYRNTMAYHCLSALVLLPGAFRIIIGTLQMVVNATAHIGACASCFCSTYLLDFLQHI